MTCLSAAYPLIFLLAGARAAGVGEAWQITPHAKSVYNDQLRPRLDSSAFEVRTVSGVGRWPSDGSENVQRRGEITAPSPAGPRPDLTDQAEETARENKSLEYLRKLFDSSYDDDGAEDDFFQKMFKRTLVARILHANDANEDDDEISIVTQGTVQRARRQASNETTSMEKISTAKNVREVRANSPETWSTSVQPISVEFRQHIPLDQVIRQQQEEEEAAALSSSYRVHQAPRADFITGQHHRRSYPEYRESRDMAIAKTYDDYDHVSSWYRNAVRERDYEYPSYRRGYSYQYPDRYKMERDYYMRLPSDPYYDRYDRYRDDDFDLYTRSRSTAKPRRIVYYATLPEIVRKPVNLRNPRPYEASRTPITRDGAYKRVPGNVDPGRYRYQYGGYDPYAKRSSYYDRPYVYPEDDTRQVRVPTRENPKNDVYGATNERKVSNLITIRDDDNKLPWPVQIGAAVSIKEDERIPGRKIFGEVNSGFERFQNAQLQKAPDATGSSELQSDN